MGFSPTRIKNQLADGRLGTTLGTYGAFRICSWSILAAKMKSLSVRPLILCAQVVISTFPQARKMSDREASVMIGDLWQTSEIAACWRTVAAAVFLFTGCPGSAFGGALSSHTVLAYIFLKTFNHFFRGPSDVQQTIPQCLFIFCQKVRNEGMAVGILNL
jgi:hypothetical protein